MISSIRSALVQALDTLFTEQGWDYPWAVENTPFEPNNEPIWFLVSFIPTEPSVATLGDGGQDGFEGILQVDLHCPLGKGEGQLLTIVDGFRNYFTAGRTFEYSSQHVTVSNCGSSNGFISNNYFRIPVSVTWYSRITRNIN